MDTLILHIEYLLLRHDCVVVPGLGALLRARHDAYYDEEKGYWMPMMEEIRFNRAVNHDDALLASSYARRQKIDYASASGIIRHLVKEIHDILHSEGEFTIGRIGTLIYENDTISFYPASSPASGAAIEGLYPVRYENARSSEVSPIKSEIQDSSTVFDTRKNFYIAVNKRMVRSVASVMIVLMIALAAILPFGRRINEDQASIVPVKILSEAIDATLDKSGTDALQALSDSIVKKDRDEPMADSTVPAEWQIIVGTFRTQEEAERYIASNGGNGYELSILSSKRLKRISALGADKKDSLIRIMNSVEFKDKYPQAWIYHVADSDGKSIVKQ